MTTSEASLHGGLLVSLNDATQMEPITFPFDSPETKRGNQTLERTDVPMTIPHTFDFWHSSSNAAVEQLYVAERAIRVDGRMVGQKAHEVLHKTMHHVIAMNAGLKREERMDMLDMVTASVMPNLITPAFVSMEMQSSQPKFLLFSREIPIHVNVFCDETCMLLVWSNESRIEQRMRDHYGNRFVVYRMPPIINSVCVIHTYFLKKKISRWKYEMRDNLRVLNALESFIFRRSKPTSE